MIRNNSSFNIFQKYSLFTNSILNQQKKIHTQEYNVFESKQNTMKISFNSIRSFSNKPSRLLYGQPTPNSHPHLLNPGELCVGIKIEEFENRRSKLLEKIPKNSIVLIPSEKTIWMSSDIPYTFRQDASFLYLTGFQEPDAFLCLEKTQKGDTIYSLFVPPRDISHELWDGIRSGVEGVKELFNPDEVFENSRFYEIVDGKIKNNKYNNIFIGSTSTNSITNNEILKKLPSIQNIFGANVSDPKSLIQSFRVIKSESEIELMKRVCNIGATAFNTIMYNCKEGMKEYQLSGMYEYLIKFHGCQRLSFPCVVASGLNANTLHYLHNSQTLKSGELVLMDSGCEYHGYASDITRTFPVNGTFSPPQKDLYERILSLQLEVIQKCRPGTTFFELNQFVQQKMKDHSVQLKINHSSILPHSIGHFLGMDVHDCQDMARQSNLEFKPGMIVTVEPGAYIPINADAPEEFRGLGYRIEDDILITDSEPYNLTSGCPTNLQEIEKIMREAREDINTTLE